MFTLQGKFALLVLVWFNKARGEKEQDLWRCKPPESCIKQCYDKPSDYVCLSKKCELGEQWNRDIAVSCTLASLMPLKSLKILSGFLIINIHSCKQYRKLSWVGTMDYHAHTGFHYAKLLIQLCHDYSIFSNISGLDLGGSEYRQVLKWLRC